MGGYSSHLEVDLQNLAFSRQIHLGIEHIKSCLAELGSVHQNMKFIHVAGTNGKGTTSDFIAQLLEKQGYSVGLYTSPHLISYTERFRINNEEIELNVLEAYFDRIKSLAEKYQLTEFEILTVIAVLYFYDRKVDYVVWETGLGGRLDATNVVPPILSVITAISVDHQQHLGDSIEEIAREKAGIIKERVPVVMLDQPPGIKGVLLDKAQACSSPVEIVPVEGNDFLSVNFKLAIRSVKMLFGDAYKDAEQLRTRLKGRLQKISRNPLVILDSAHNQAGIENAVAYMKKTADPWHIVFGATHRQELGQIMEFMMRVDPNLTCCEFDFYRAVSADFYRKYVSNGANIVLKEELPAYIKTILDQKGKKFFITGSIYFLGEVLKIALL